jgi:biopolymer transport protein ExbB
MSLWIEKGGPVMWPLLLLSVIAIAIVIERGLFWRREKRRSVSEALGELESECTNGSFEEASSRTSMLLDREQRRMERGMPILDTVITVAPLLGILGTVLGIIDSLELLSVHATPDPLAVSGGVAQALFTTATGLAIAIAAILPYNYFRTRTRERLGMLEHELLGRHAQGGVG